MFRKPSPAQRNVGAPPWRWHHGVAFYVGVQAAMLGLGRLAAGIARPGSPDATRNALFGEDEYFNGLTQARIAPPDWAFAPAWFVNNVLAIWGLLHVANLPPDTPGRSAFIRLQLASWVLYGAFNGAFFGLRSPINAAVLTDLSLGLGLASHYVTLFRMKDARAALSLATLTPWLVLAAPTATSLALWNRDAFYDVGPFATPPAGWSKRPAD